MSKRKIMGLFATPVSMEVMQEYVDKFSGREKEVAKKSADLMYKALMAEVSEGEVEEYIQSLSGSYVTIAYTCAGMMHNLVVSREQGDEDE